MKHREYECPLTLALEIIRGKWKTLVMYHLRHGTLRTGEIKRRIPGITQKMLTQQLRELERDGLVIRKTFDTVPPRVEYSLTELGVMAKPILEAMCSWGWTYAEKRGSGIVFQIKEVQKPTAPLPR
ncbi:MAG: helix-turn-helix transcriptional regulator [Synergistaceae bacterium]|jgi:DNA-binding HxlR family transcriptional regulator|nr:helix-turn-helix transcriptional regulator [Synergistaceae bacterium]